MNQAFSPSDNFQHWDHRDYFTFIEAAMLLNDRDPVTEPFDGQDPAFRFALKTIWQDAKEGSLVVTFAGNTAPANRAPEIVLYAPGDYEFAEAKYSRIYRKDLLSWATAKGLTPKFLRRDIERLGVDADIRALPFECPDHLQPWVALMLRAYEEHWLKHDPNDPNSKRPSNADVARWIQKQLVDGARVPGDVASVFARLVRPADAPIGRRPDTEDEKYG